MRIQNIEIDKIRPKEYEQDNTVLQKYLFLYQ